MNNSIFVRKFIAFKSRAYAGKQLRRNDGKFVIPDIQAQWAAFQEGARVALPEVAPDAWLDAMAGNGVRREWCEDVYKTMRAKVYEDLETMKGKQ